MDLSRKFERQQIRKSTGCRRPPSLPSTSPSASHLPHDSYQPSPHLHPLKHTHIMPVIWGLDLKEIHPRKFKQSVSLPPRQLAALVSLLAAPALRHEDWPPSVSKSDRALRVPDDVTRRALFRPLRGGRRQPPCVSTVAHGRGSRSHQGEARLRAATASGALAGADVCCLSICAHPADSASSPPQFLHVLRSLPPAVHQVPGLPGGHDPLRGASSRSSLGAGSGLTRWWSGRRVSDHLGPERLHRPAERFQGREPCRPPP